MVDSGSGRAPTRCDDRWSGGPAAVVLDGGLAQALIERELRGAMQREDIAELPLYPEQRACRRPTTEQVLRLFSLAQRHRLTRAGETVQVFEVELTDLQRRILGLLRVREAAYRARD